MLENRIKRKMRQGKLAIGSPVNLANTALVEIIGIAGFDAAFIDMEHSSLDFKSVEELILACERVGIASLIRVPDHNPKTILRLLDIGAQGIQVPHVTGKQDALEAVKAVRYAPLGERGMSGPSRASRFGSVPKDEHIRTSNEEIVLIVMIEDLKAVQELPDIASIEGLDLVAVGPSDLSQNLGVSDRSDPRLKNTIDNIATTLKRLGKAKMAFPMDQAGYPLNAFELQKMGVAYSNCYPSDYQILMRSYQEKVKEIERLLG